MLGVALEHQTWTFSAGEKAFSNCRSALSSDRTVIYMPQFWLMSVFKDSRGRLRSSHCSLVL